MAHGEHAEACPNAMQQSRTASNPSGNGVAAGKHAPAAPTMIEGVCEKRMARREYRREPRFSMSELGAAARVAAAATPRARRVLRAFFYAARVRGSGAQSRVRSAVQNE